MSTIEIDILNPKANKLIDDLVELNLIAIRSASDNDFLNTADKIRKKAKNDSITLEEITKEVETVRAKRYASKTKSKNSN